MQAQCYYNKLSILIYLTNKLFDVHEIRDLFGQIT